MQQGHPLSFNTRKTLCVQLGETAGKEVADLLEQLAYRMNTVERTKVDVIPIVPEPKTEAQYKRAS